MTTEQHGRRLKRPPPRRSRGFTLVELIITMAIVAILAAVAMPSFRELRIRTNITQTTNDLIIDLNTARAEAVKRGYPVAVIAKPGGWAAGWQVQSDNDINGTFGNAGDELLRDHAAVAATYDLRGAPKVAGGPADRVIFNSSGFSTSGDFDFVVCRPDTNNDQNRAVLIQTAGIVSNRRKPLGLAVACN
ncbi:GspH/FimT family pseudopilin [Tahibacter harae]|uniref:Type II secretion system protein H n=1 Tax=Tahibacter harae TaxID=2963937 RepID=A0ABT1QML8_9GAMM|nr:GspH/FimT family pseudopilin [Tahibacter harae]MCQ4163780.1 GspH/FimT family pseudopilin [Tahibacter harae]